MYETELPNAMIPAVDNQMMYDPGALPMASVRSGRRMPQNSDVEAGRNKLHRLLDEVLDKADMDEGYDPDSETERQKRRRQRRRMNVDGNDQRMPLVHNNSPPIRHTPIIAQVAERPDPTLLRTRFDPYEAADRVRDIERTRPVEFRPKYATDDNDIPSRYGPGSTRSNPPLFYDDGMLPDRAMTASNLRGTPKRQGQSRIENDREAMLRRQSNRPHRFDNDVVYVDTIDRTRSGQRVPVRDAWGDDNDNYFHINPSDIIEEPVRRGDYRDEYMMAKRSVANTKNLISTIQDELQHIVSDSDNYHA